MVEHTRNFLLLGVSVLAGLACAPAARAQGPTAGPNVNMVSGTDWTTGDPFLQRQNEPSIAVSTRNASHLLGGANDYRSVDLAGLVGIKEQGDAWLGVFKSFDSGQTWRSTLLPGYPLDSSLAGLVSPIHGFQAASDPMVRAGSNGLLYYSGLAFNRGPGGLSEVFLARFIDRNNKENGDPTNKVGVMTNVVPRDPIRYTGIFPIAFGTDDVFLDKPSLAVDIPRSSATCTVFVPENGTIVTETIPAGKIYVAYTALYTADGDDDDDQLPKVPTAIFFKRSSNCGYTWSAPINLSGPNQKNQGSVIAIDPNNGTIYVAWRRFASGAQPDAILIRKSTDGGNSFSPAVAAVTFLPPASAKLSCAPPPTGDPTQPGCPFDQSVTTFSFRTNDYGTLTVDGSGRVYLAWTQRSASASELGDARIMMNVSQDGVNWPSSSVAAVDDSFLYDDYGMPLQTILGRGHQVMPSLSFNAGKLMLAYYDLREDHTVGVFSPKLSNPADPLDPSNCSYGTVFPCNLGAQYLEARDPVGDPLAGPNVFNPYIFDGPDPVLSAAPPITRRHTIDVEAAQAAPLPAGTLGVPGFTPFRVSRYTFGIPPTGVALADPTQIIKDSSGQPTVQQLQFNPPNLPLFVHGTNAFMGDYIEVAGAPTMIFDPVARAWKFNTTPAPSPIFHAVWADNRNVRPPLNGDWTSYTPPFSASNPSGGGTSKFDPTKTVPICTTGSTAGMRNQDIYTAQIAEGLVVSSLQTAKPLLNNGQPGIQRAFTVLVKNATGAERSFQMNTKVTPATAPVTASFKQFSMVTSVNLVPIPAFSSIAFPVFVQATSTTTNNVSVEVDITEMLPAVSTATPLQGSVVLNSDPSNPTLISPDNAVFGSSTILTAEFYNPLMSTATADYTANNTNLINPAGGNPAGGNPAGGNPAGGNPAGGNVTVTDPTLSTLPNPAGGNPAGGNGTLENPAGGNPAGGNPAGGNTAVADQSWSVTNQGNTSATYIVQLFPTGTIPLCAADGTGTNCVNLQLLISKLYPTQTVDLQAANSCQLTTQFSNELIASIPNPSFTSSGNLGNPAGGNPAGGNPAGGNPAGGNPAGGNAALGDATFALAPGGSAQITLRITGPKGSQNPPSPDVVNQVINSLVPVTVSQAVNTVDAQAGSTQPPVSSPGSPIVITNTLPGGANPLPDGEVAPPGPTYRANLTRIGGVGPFAWTAMNGWFNSQGVAITPEGCSAGLPPGVTLTDAVNGVISGNPTAAGNYCFTAKVTDAATNTATANLEVRIAAPLVITTASPLPTATQGTGYGPVNFAATGGILPYSWTILVVEGPATVDGISLSSGGVFAGIPTSTGVFNFTVQVTDSGSPRQSASSAMTLNVVPFTPNPTNGGLLFDNWNTAAVLSGPPTATTFYLPSTTKITQMANYHYFNGGALPGTISIQNQNGQVFGPFATVGVPGQGGVANAAWVGSPNVIVPAGTYTVIDSNSATWSYNATFSTIANGQVNCNCGFTRVWGFAVPVLVVINAADTGPGSLRQAILDFNQSSSLVGIIFNIPGNGVQTIGPQTDLPALTKSASLDATTQPGYAGTPLIELNGSVGIAVNGLHIAAGNSTVRGFVINRFSGDGILLDTNGGDVIQANYVGTDVTGTVAQPNGGDGIHIIDTPNNTIGGTTPTPSNVISGNAGEGIRIDGAFATGNLVQGNNIGTSASGSVEVGNNASGVYIRRAPGNSVIGNVVAGNIGFAGITICGNLLPAPGFCGGGDIGTQGNNASGNVVQGNLVGSNPALHNLQAGVSIDGAPNTLVGGATVAMRNIIAANGTNGVQIFSLGADGNKIQGNVIASNRAAGISVRDGIGNTLTKNSILGHTSGLGIDLAPAGVNLNTSGGAHNFPVITSAPLANGTTTINGTLNGTPSTAYTIEFFSNASCNSSGYGEGATFLGSTNVGTDGSGNASFSFSAAAPATQSVFTTTATDAGGTTSEFSACMPFPVATAINLTPSSAGALMAGQSFNETRAADVKVLTTGPLTVSSMTLSGLDIVGSSATVGARIYDSSTGALVASGDATVNAGSQQTITIPVAATLASGATYRVGFYVQTTPSSGGSGTVFVVNSFPYNEPTGRFQIVAAWDSTSAGDAFPTVTNTALPQMTITVAP